MYITISVMSNCVISCAPIIIVIFIPAWLCSLGMFASDGEDVGPFVGGGWVAKDFFAAYNLSLLRFNK